MMTISALGAAGENAHDYYTSVAGGREDYYVEGKEPPGEWLGAGAAALGLVGDVRADQLRAVMEGRAPDGRDLVQGAGARHRAGWDCTMSAPKSVSAAWAVADPPMRAALERAQERAVHKALGYLTEHTVTRRGKGGGEREKIAGLVAAAFAHHTSREQDPQLHHHALVANLAARADGTWGTIESRDLYMWQKAIGTRYRAELARELRTLGFSVERDGRDTFKIAGVSADACKAFSTRRAQIEAALAEHGGCSAEASEYAALETRRTKEEIDHAILRERWQERAAAHGLTAATLDEIRAPEYAASLPTPPAAPTSEELLRDATTLKSTLRARDIDRLAAIEAQYDSKRTFEQIRSHLLASHELVTLGRDSSGERRYSTRELIEIERKAMATARTLAGDKTGALSPRSVAEAAERFEARHGFRLSDEQRNALDVCATAGRLAAVRGIAGAGKSTLLDALREAREGHGDRVIGAALAAKAARGLEGASGIQSQTIHSLLDQLDRRHLQLDRRTVLIIDEAAMCSTRQLARVLEHVKKAGAQCVMVGDPKQLQAIEASGIFAACVRDEHVSTAELTQIRRQHKQVDRDVVHALEQGDVEKALESMDDRGLIHVAQSQTDAMHQLVADWLSTRDPAKPGESLMLAGSRADVHTLNALARAALRERGEIGQHDVPVEVRTGPESTALRDFARGDRVSFTRNSGSLDVQNGTLGTLENVTLRADGSADLRVRLDNGRVVAWSSTECGWLSHSFCTTVHKSQGGSLDRTHVLLSEGMSDTEWSYVAMSRARVETRLYCDAEIRGDLARIMSRSHRKDLAIDYVDKEQEHAALEERDDEPQPTQPRAPQPPPRQTPAQPTRSVERQPKESRELEMQDELEL